MMIFMLLFWLAVVVLCVSVMRSVFAPDYEPQPIKQKRLPNQNNVNSEVARENEHALYKNKYNQQENHHVY